MNKSYWYITADRTAVTWGTAVAAGKATTDIYELQVINGAQVLYLWARSGATVTADSLAHAQAREEAGAVPAPNAAVGGRGIDHATQAELSALEARVATLESAP